MLKWMIQEFVVDLREVIIPTLAVGVVMITGAAITVRPFREWLQK